MFFIERFFDPPKKGGCFVFGQGGTGKSTWLEVINPDPK